MMKHSTLLLTHFFNGPFDALTTSDDQKGTKGAEKHDLSADQARDPLSLDFKGT